ncbi:MAG: UbiA family prenyltransferase, partial [Candidatus Micrarchaeaceae archaeon]
KGNFPGYVAIIASIITPIFISMASFAINDYFDIEVDKANNKKNAPLVSGEITKNEALWVTAITLIIGVFASVFINYYAFVMAFIFGALAMLYSYKLKEILLIGNIYIAFSMAIPFIYGNFVVADKFSFAILIVSSMVFISGLAREIHGTIRDYNGDKKRKINSLPKVIGIIPSAIVAAILYIIAVIISIYLFLFKLKFHSFIYLGLILLTDILIMYVSINYLRKKSSKFYNLSRNLSLLAMGIALFGILLAPITYFAF